MTQLTIDYAAHDRVRELVDRLKHSAESISLAFTEWEEPHVKGPGLYFAVISDREYGQYADAMGANQWPTHQCESVFDEAPFTDACLHTRGQK